MTKSTTGWIFAHGISISLSKTVTARTEEFDVFAFSLPGQTKVAASIMGKDRGTQNAELDRGGCCCTIACAAGQRFSGAALPNSNIGFVFGNRLNKTDVYSTRKCGMVFDEGA